MSTDFRFSRLRAIILVLSVSILLAACGGGGGGASKTLVAGPDNQGLDNNSGGNETDPNTDADTDTDTDPGNEPGDDEETPPDPSPVARYAFTVNNADNDISTYVVDPDTGRLNYIAQASTGNDPVALAVHPSNDYVYVVNAADDSISQYAIGADGRLTELAPAVAAGNSPQAIVPHPSGDFVYVTNYGSDTISQYQVGADGSLTALANPNVVAPGAPWEAGFDPEGNYLYVTSTGDHSIALYAIGEDGELDYIDAFTAPLMPLTLAFHPSGDHLYVAGVTDNTVWTYAVAANGELDVVGAVGTGAYPIAMAVDPAGDYVYVANTLGDSISQYSVNASGSLTSIDAPIATGEVPRAISVDPSSSFVYLASSGFHSVHAYGIGGDGHLTELAPAHIPTGGRDPRAMALSSGDVAAKAVSQHLYAANFASGTVSQYHIEENGALIAMAAPTANAGAENMANEVNQLVADPTGRFAYAINPTNQRIYQFIVGSDGELEDNGFEATDPMTARNMTMHPSGRYMFVSSDYNGGLVATVRILPDGSLDYVEAAATTNATPTKMAVHPNGRYLYLVSDDDFPTQRVEVFSIALSGTLTSLDAVNPGIDLRNAIVDASGRYLYVPHGNQVTQYNIDQNDGSISYMTDPWVGATGAATLALSPLTDYAYVPQLTDHTIAQFSVKATGNLQGLIPKTIYAETAPSDALVDGSGRFVYVSNYGSGNVSQFVIGDDGQLSEIDFPIASGTAPNSLLILNTYE